MNNILALDDPCQGDAVPSPPLAWYNAEWNDGKMRIQVELESDRPEDMGASGFTLGRAIGYLPTGMK